MPRPSALVHARAHSPRGSRRSTSRRAGLTVLELLVAVAIIGLLLAITIPAVQRVRETSRQHTCRARLAQIGRAITAYEGVHQRLPSGGPSGYGMHRLLLPYLDQQPLSNAVGTLDVSLLPRDIAAMPVPVYHCASAPFSTGNRVSFACNMGTGVQVSGFDGFFRYELVDWGIRPGPVPWRSGPLRVAHVRDGMSMTVALSEIACPHRFPAHADDPGVVRAAPDGLDDPARFEELTRRCASEGASWAIVSSQGGAWWGGDPPETMYNHVLPPNQPSCDSGLVQTWVLTAGSEHPGGCLSLYGDGHVEFISEAIDPEVWRASGSRGLER